MSMSKFLAEFYGTDGSVKEAAAAAEDTEKMASVEIFMKLAKDQNIDLASMKQEEVNALYNGWVTKTSAATTATTKTAEEEEEEGKEKKKEEAKKEFEEKKAQQEKIAEADFLGRVMAHSFAQESREIAKTASNLAAAKDFAGKSYMGAKNLGQHAHELKHKATEGAKAVGEHLGKNFTPYAVGAAGAAGATAGHALGKNKESSAIEDLASYRAVTLAHENGLDAEEAARKIAAVIELGLNKPSEKIASAPDVETAVGIRALELLETAGYPVTWTA
jgi:hypothetical protein